MTLNNAIAVTFMPVDADVSSSATVTGFLHLWAVYVTGFNPSYHCQRCLRGRISKFVGTRSTPVIREIVFSETANFDVVYICGVASGKISERWRRNLQLPLLPSPGESFDYTTYNNYKIRVKNARLLSIPLLEESWMGLSPAFTRCSNFRFCVSFFGLPEWFKERNAISSSRL